MLLDDFHARTDTTIRISADQASRFAKDIAGDFNPIHDVDSRQFCVPGDLLFALALQEYGVSRNMDFTFLGLVGEQTALHFPATDAAIIDITDSAGKPYLRIERSGEIIDDTAFIDDFIRAYVAFSGRNFPHYLQPLLQEHGVMFNPDRPLVIYDSMGFSLDGSGGRHGGPSLEYSRGDLEVTGKRGKARLEFRIHAGEDNVAIGHGSKKLIISGLREYDDERMNRLVREFNQHKQAYEAGFR